MALKRQQDMMATFSMASMTDVIFLLLVFFLVTSTFVFPTALDINLPESAEQTPAKPTTRVFIDAESNLYVSYDNSELLPVESEHLIDYLQIIRAQDPESGIAVYADVEVPYGKVVEVLNLGAENSMKMVLATRPISNQPQSAAQ
ncbi:MAG: biopolymer transporter ExbD [Muribaculaceae bacterium]|nr:biopolymer transporter ExbD [Muribaculaceae bacterium]MDE5595819.1 biopolymer transporter ExbD [Muribaculaceae bacterium]MDE6703485.1 biopolymer transporter ExbD [Muribaculaceae bacterium]